MKNRSAVLLAGLVVLCAGCCSVPQTVEVRVPVPVSCVNERPPRPTTATAAEMKAMDDYHLTLTLARDLALMRVYALKLEAAMAGCE